MAWKTYQKLMKAHHVPVWFKYLYYGLLMGVNAGCTYSVVMNHTEGEASDVVDTNQTASPDVSPEITLPKAS
jgi:hypothetical protein